MNINSISKEKCTGCGLCSLTCPQSAIVMKEDFEGFLCPHIDESRCVNCGECYVKCQDYMQTSHKHSVKSVKACQTNDSMWLIESTAGGFFPTLAQWVIELGGVVFGTAYDEYMNAIVCKASTIDEIRKFNGSKYVQSPLYMALDEIKEELEKGRYVLFSGTPCQNAAVLSFCKGCNLEKLFTIDVICYGVPSPGLFRAFICETQRKVHGRIVDFRFRDKHKYGWSHTTVIRVEKKNGKHKTIVEKDYRKIPYYRMFGKRNCFRKTCYSCQYNTIDRITDFTTGNFWNIDKYTSVFDSHNGVSMVLINTDKASTVYERIKARLTSLDMSVQQAVSSNDALVKSSTLTNERDEIYKFFSENGFKKTYKKYYPINYINSLFKHAKILFKRLNKHG